MRNKPALATREQQKYENFFVEEEVNVVFTQMSAYAFSKQRPE